MTISQQQLSAVLAKLTLEERVAQLTQLNLGELALVDDKIDDDALAARLAGKGVGVICISPKDSPETSKKKIQAVQKCLKEKTSHGIQALVAAECVHGVLTPGATIFPQALAMGSSWNRDLVKAIGEAIALEASSMGITQALSPVLDLGRDPRFGRIEESYGECPTLVKHLGLAYIHGMQGDDVTEGLAQNKVLCTPKHFAGYSTPANGLNCAPVSCGEREFRSLHLVPFAYAITNGGILAIMPSYNEVDGTPSHANKWLLDTVLRGELGFQGYVYSDWGGVSMNAESHHIAADWKGAAKLAINAGVDLDAPEAHAYRHLADMVREGMIAEAAVDRACSRVLHVKAMAGLIEGRVTPDATPVHCQAHIQLSRSAAEESIILLENRDGMLPFNASTLKSLAVIGPNADQVQFGDYCWTKNNKHGVSVLRGIQQLVGNDIEIHHAQGCSLVGLSTDGFQAAAEIAGKCDVAIVVIGDTSSVSGGIGWEDTSIPSLGTVGETFDVSDPVPPGVQLDLVKAIHATGTPTIVIMLNGRPYSVPWIKKNIPGVILAFYPGEKQGTAIADILFGNVNPSGRLPVSIAQSAGHIPTVYDWKPTGRGSYGRHGSPEKPGRDYVFSTPDPLWAFGHGCSYTRFDYVGLEIQTPEIKPDGVLAFSVELRNSGTLAGKEVVQVYFNDKVSSRTTPCMRLLAFEKVALRPGETRQVSFEVAASELGLWNDAMQFVVEPGEFELIVGSSAADIKFRKSFVVQLPSV